MDPANAGPGTPTTRWAPQSWWVGDDARSEDGYASDRHPMQLPPAVSGSQRRRSQLSAVDPDTVRDQIQQQGMPYRDPRSMFGDLPNSSFNPDSLGDPIQRELELRAAESAAVRRPLADAPAVTFADTSRPRSPMFWRDECGRLQDQLASLVRERERWEWDRRRLLAEDADRARDLAGLRRAVEAQSQLVMESLVVAQRLAASGAASTSTGGKPLALSDDVLQTTWVQPNVPPATTRNLPWGQGRVGTAFEPSQCGFPLFSRAGVATNRVRSEHSCPGVAENKSFDRRQSGSHRIADATTSSSPDNSTAAASTIVGETRPDQAYAIAASGASAPSRALYEPLTIANKSNNKNEQKVPRSLTVVPASTGTTLAPRVSFSARERTPQANADRAHSSTSGWRCIASSRGSGGSGGTTVGGEGRGDTENGESEVWEWNGRRVVIHRSPARPPLVEKGPEQEAKSSGGQERAAPAQPSTEKIVETSSVAPAAATEDAAASESVVPASLLKDIQEIKAAVQALALGAVDVRASIPQTLPEQAVATTPPSPSEVDTGFHQLKPPENASRQDLGASPSTPIHSPTRRRVSVPTSSNMPPTRQPRASSIAYIPNRAPGMEEREGPATFPKKTAVFSSISDAPAGGGSNGVEAVGSSPDDSPTDDGGDDDTERQRRPRESEQAQHYDGNGGRFPRGEVSGVLQSTQGREEESTSLRVPAVSPPTSALQEQDEGEEIRRRPSAPSTGGGGEGGAVDAVGGDQHDEPPLLDDNSLVPVTRGAYLLGSSSRDDGGTNGGGVLVDPETSVVDEANQAPGKE